MFATKSDFQDVFGSKFGTPKPAGFLLKLDQSATNVGCQSEPPSSVSLRSALDQTIGAHDSRRSEALRKILIDPLELATPFSNLEILKFHQHSLSLWPRWRFIIFKRIICHWTWLFDEVIPAVDDRFRPGTSPLLQQEPSCLSVWFICGGFSQPSHIMHINFPPISLANFGFKDLRLEYHSVPTSLNDMRKALEAKTCRAR